LSLAALEKTDFTIASGQGFFADMRCGDNEELHNHADPVLESRCFPEMRSNTFGQTVKSKDQISFGHEMV